MTRLLTADLFLCASGLESQDADVQNVSIMAQLALRLQQERFFFVYKIDGDEQAVPVHFRFGMHAGELLCGVMSRTRFCYDVMGQTVNFAARMEQMSDPNRILCTQDVAQMLEPLGFVFSDNGVVEVKGIGLKPTFFLEGFHGKPM